MPELVLGPLLRYVSDTEATVWVQTGERCEVEILGRREPTFRVEDHHYALVRLEGLEPDTTHEYEVALDGERVWPADGRLPPSAIRTLGGTGPVDIRFGSCRVALPQEPPFTDSADRDQGFEPDALWVLAKQMAGSERRRWPDHLFLLGDQVYVDECSPKARAKIRRRRGTATPPGEQVLDFEEYASLSLDGRRATLFLDRTVPGADDADGLVRSFERRLA